MRATPPAICKIDLDGKKTKVAEVTMSGSKLGPDGRLYACGTGQVIAIDLATGKKTVLAEGVEPNDLVVDHVGHIYITETKKTQVTLIDPKGGAPRVVDTGTKKPNGITLTPDQKTLLVSEAGGVSIWGFTIQPDGSLADRKPLMTMKAPDNKPGIAGGDGMTTDEAGRCYVATALGCQIFNRDGTLLGIVPRPQEGPMPSVGFAGPDRQYLYAMAGTKIYRRKTQAKGAVFFVPPMGEKK
jgi:enterochelin esterase family protein